MASLNNNNRKREVHNRTSLTYRKGKQRLRPLSAKQLTSKLESAQSNRLKDAVSKELARRIRMGMV
jgi:hypothetical protein